MLVQGAASISSLTRTASSRKTGDKEAGAGVMDVRWPLFRCVPYRQVSLVVRPLRGKEVSLVVSQREEPSLDLKGVEQWQIRKLLI